MKDFFEENKKQLILTLIIGAFIFLALSVNSFFHSVPAGHKGVYVVFGKVSDQVLDEGLHIKNPFANIVNIDIREQREEINLATYTRDIQMSNLSVVFTYALNGDKVALLYRTVGKDYQNKLITPILETAVKDVVGKWEADKLVENRTRAISDMTEFLTKSLNKEFIRFGSFSLTKIAYSEVFEKSIEEKQIATQNAIKAKNDTVRIQEEAKQQVISAKAEAEAMQIKSNALATNKGLTEYEAVMKWDGKLPTYTGGVIPFINVPNTPK